MKRSFNNLPIAKGAHLFWPTRRGSKMWMNEGIVVSTQHQAIVVKRIDTGRHVHLRNTDTILVMPEEAHAQPV